MKYFGREDMQKKPEIIFCDNHLLVVVKPPEMPTQESEGQKECLEDFAKDWVKKKYNKPGNVFLQPIHRLDKPVTGIVVFARTSKALSRLQEMQRERKMEKIYHAYVEGKPSTKTGDLVHYLSHEAFRSKVVSSSHTNAQRAELKYTVLKEFPLFSLLEISLVTGRYHQIRSQLSAIGCPILGDRKYGAKLDYQGKGIALFHTKISFVHPVTRSALSFSIDCPDEKWMRNLLAIS